MDEQKQPTMAPDAVGGGPVFAEPQEMVRVPKVLVLAAKEFIAKVAFNQLNRSERIALPSIGAKLARQLQDLSK